MRPLISRFKQASILAASLVLSAFALAAESEGAHGAHGEHGPGMDVVYQAINFTLFAALIFFLARKKAAAHFVGRDVTFREALNRAENARKDAERRRREMSEKISLLQAEAASSLDEAKVEADRLRAKMAEEAKAIREGMKEDAVRAVETELARAKAELREEMIGQSMSLAARTLAEKIAEPDQKRLQTEFVEKIQAVPS